MLTSGAVAFRLHNLGEAGEQIEFNGLDFVKDRYSLPRVFFIKELLQQYARVFRGGFVKQ